MHILDMQTRFDRNYLLWRLFLTASLFTYIFHNWRKVAYVSAYVCSSCRRDVYIRILTSITAILLLSLKSLNHKHCARVYNFNLYIRLIVWMCRWEFECHICIEFNINRVSLCFCFSISVYIMQRLTGSSMNVRMAFKVRVRSESVAQYHHFFCIGIERWATVAWIWNADNFLRVRVTLSEQILFISNYADSNSDDVVGATCATCCKSCIAKMSAHNSQRRFGLSINLVYCGPHAFASLH